MVRRGALAAVLALVLAAGHAPAQEAPRPASPILTVDQEALFEGSAYGRAALAAFERDSAALVAENRRIEDDLEAEEQRLTEERAVLDPALFREKAAAFDARVVEIRRAQDEKARALSRAPDEARQAFFRAALPVLTDLVRERGSVAILDRRALILAAESIDITQTAIQRIDATLGDGAAARPDAPRDDAPR